MKPQSLRLSFSRRRCASLAAAGLALPLLWGGLVTAAGAAPSVLHGRWLAETMRNRGVIANVQMVIDIAADGKVTGSGGCNLIRGRLTVSEARISFGPMIATKMACAPEIMDQESKFLSALGEARLWRIDEQRDKLILVDAHGVTILRLLRM